MPAGGAMSPALADRLVAFSRRIDGFNDAAGTLAAWLGVGTVVMCFASVYLRYAFGIGFTWMQESYIWTHVFSIMLGSGFALLAGGFVRVDLLYERFGKRLKAGVDFAGTLLFMAPFLAMTAFSGWAFFLASWKMNESSQQQDGIAAVYALKASLLLFVLVVGLQGLGLLAKSAAAAFAPPPEA